MTSVEINSQMVAQRGPLYIEQLLALTPSVVVPQTEWAALHEEKTDAHPSDEKS